MTDVAGYAAACLLVGLALACWFDVCKRIVPNVLTIPFFFVGLGIAWIEPTRSLSTACQSAAVAFALMFLPFVVRLYKGGDLKLMVACSTWLQPLEVAWAILFGVILGGVLGVIHLGGDKQRWRSLRAHLVLLVFRQATVAPNLERSDAEGTVPMALAFSLAVVGVAFWGTPWA